MPRLSPAGRTRSPHSRGAGRCPLPIRVLSEPQDLMAFGKKVFADEIEGQGEILWDQGGLWTQRVLQ